MEEAAAAGLRWFAVACNRLVAVNAPAGRDRGLDIAVRTERASSLRLAIDMNKQTTVQI